MKVLVIDGQGGRLGMEIIDALRAAIPGVKIRAVGTNARATATMMKAGADSAATGENPVIVACREADFIIGPLGIVIADSLVGEMTPAMALAVSQSPAVRVLIPMNRCDNLVAGLKSQSMSELVADAVQKVLGTCESEGIE